MTGTAMNVAAGGGEQSPLLQKSAVRSAPIEIRSASPARRMNNVHATKGMATSTYGTLPLKEAISVKRCNEPECDPVTSHGCNNQSETESDSDMSCGSSNTSQTLILPPSILRIRSNDPTPRSYEKKNSSVEFAIDIDDTDDEDDEDDGDDKSSTSRGRRKSCAARYMPRRLTSEEKAELYRVRPDLDQTPVMSFIVRDMEEMRRKRQRRAVFSMLGGTLILLMLVVMYYVFSQV